MCIHTFPLTLTLYHHYFLISYTHFNEKENNKTNFLLIESILDSLNLINIIITFNKKISSISKSVLFSSRSFGGDKILLTFFVSPNSWSKLKARYKKRLAN